MSQKIILMLCIIMIGAVCFAFNFRSISNLILVKNETPQEFETKWNGIKPGSNFFDTYQSGDLRIARLEPNYSWRKVKKIYGEPLKIELKTEESANNPAFIAYYTSYFYPEIIVNLVTYEDKNKPQPKDPGKLFSVIVTGNKFKSFRGIKVGDSLDKVKERYGPVSDFSSFAQNSDTITYDFQLSYISFKISDDEVASIEIGTSPD